MYLNLLVIINNDSFLKGSRVILDCQLKFSHRIVTIASNEVGSRTIRKFNLLRKVLDCLLVLMHFLKANATIVEIMQVIWVS